METFQLIVFLISAVALPWGAIAVMKAHLRSVGKLLLLVVLAVVARYLLWAVWTPEEMWLLWVKMFIVTGVFYVVWFEALLKLIDTSSSESTRPLVSFVSFMLFFKLFHFLSQYNYYFGLNIFFHQKTHFLVHSHLILNNSYLVVD